MKKRTIFSTLLCATLLSATIVMASDKLSPIETETAYAETTIPLENGTLLNSCDEKAIYWLNSNNFEAGNVTLDLTIKTQGNASTRVVAKENNFITVSLRHYNQSGNPVLTEEELLAYDNLYLEVYNTESGNINLFMYNCLAATLAPGWNSVVIPKETTKAQIDESQAAYEANNWGVRQYVNGEFYFAVYADCTLLFDNVRGVSDEELDNSDNTGSGSTQEFACEYSAVSAQDYSFVQYGSSSVTNQTASQAAASGVPSGYTDNVITVSGGNANGMGVLLDFSSLKIPAAKVESLTVRMYYPDDTSSNSYPNIRIRRIDGVDDWVVNYAGKANAGTWFDFTLKSDGTNFNGNHNFSHLSSNGYLDKFELGVRTGNTAPFYIDSISYTLSEIDIDVPVITYNGSSTVYWLADDRAFTLDASATDKTQGNIDLEYVWSSNTAVNADGSLNAGTYTLTLTATDAAGNSATLPLTVIAVAPETVAPVIALPTDTVTLFVGTKPQLLPNVTDNSGVPPTVTTAWSHGALDKRGRLTVGTHTYTITAVDLSGNTATKTVSVCVIATEDWYDNALDEANPHVYSTNWSVDDTSHWHACSCGLKADEATHTDEDNNGACDVCSYTYTPTTPPEGGEGGEGGEGNTPTTPPESGEGGEGNEGGDNEGNTPTTPPESGEGGEGNEGGDNEGNTPTTPPDEEHEHKHSPLWNSSVNMHWRECTCGDKADMGTHSDNDKNGKCDVCNHDVPLPNPPEGGDSGNEDEGEGDDVVPPQEETPPSADNQETTNPNETDEEEKGCKSAVGSVFASVGLALTACLFVKRKKKSE